MRRRSPFPRYVHAYNDRHGALRTYFRRGADKVALPRPPLSDDWWQAYRAFLAGDLAKAEETRQVGAERTLPGTVSALVVAYLTSADYAALAPVTKANRRNILDRWREQWGDRRLKDLQARHVVGWLDERRDTPAAAQNFLKALKPAARHGVAIGLLQTDPTASVKAPRAKKTGGFHPWSDEEVGTYRAHHALGTNARLALELLIGTAQRRSDVVRMGRQHLRGDVIQVRQGKTGATLVVPIGPSLAAALAAVPADHLTFLVTGQGKPYSAAGFGNQFREWVDQSGLPKACAAHGLRKAACRQLAEAGCTAHEIQAISGHVTLAEVQRYCAAADQAVLARRAAKKRTQIG
jgi:integrase